MSYVIKARLSNAQHRENGCNEIMFPLSRKDYEDEIDRLAELEAGDAIVRDCYVEDIDSFYGVLDCLKGQTINVDELDYLAKRLESFDEYEAQQFQAVCHVFGCHHIASFINMTFCAQECTVISDFNKLEEAGKQHYLTIHGGSAPVDELKQVDGKALAEKLIQSGDGELTPYGLFFRNEMMIPHLYDGHGFPPYLWEVKRAEVELLKSDGKPVTVFLPTTKLEFERFCKRNDLKMEELKPEGLSWLGNENDNVEINGGLGEMWEWNEVCERLDGLSESERLRCFAAFEVMAPDGSEQAELLINNVQDFTLRPGVKTAEDLGRYMIQKSGQYGYDPTLEPFYNYEGFGEYLMEHGLGQMTRQGYLECLQISAFADFFSQDAPEQKQTEGDAVSSPKTLRDVILQNPQASFHILSPDGFIDLTPEMAKAALEGGEIRTHPGAAECFSKVEAEMLLSQFVIEESWDGNNCGVMCDHTPREPTRAQPEQQQAQEQRSPCLGLGYRPAPPSQEMTMGGM